MTNNKTRWIFWSSRLIAIWVQPWSNLMIGTTARWIFSRPSKDHRKKLQKRDCIGSANSISERGNSRRLYKALPKWETWRSNRLAKRSNSWRHNWNVQKQRHKKVVNKPINKCSLHECPVSGHRISKIISFSTFRHSLPLFVSEIIDEIWFVLDFGLNGTFDFLVHIPDCHPLLHHHLACEYLFFVGIEYYFIVEVDDNF